MYHLGSVCSNLIQACTIEESSFLISSPKVLHRYPVTVFIIHCKKANIDWPRKSSIAIFVSRPLSHDRCNMCDKLGIIGVMFDITSDNEP